MPGARHAYDMGLIGNCSYLAYVDRRAAVRWLCMPRFDSSFLFGSLLDTEKGGRFEAAPADEAIMGHQAYLGNTNILSTEFVTPSGRFRVTDCAPRFKHFERSFRPLMIIRRIEPLSGHPMIRVICRPAAGESGEAGVETVMGSNHIRFMGFESQVRLTTDIPIHYILRQKAFILDSVKYLVFTYGEPMEAPLVSTAEDFLEKTRKYWVDWAKTSSIPSHYQEEVIRSALVLKIHQYEDTGGIIASGTTSLPEVDGEGRNWDYRYCWIRDAYYTLNAFNNIGHFEELERYAQYIQNVVLSEEKEIQPVYGVGGEKVLSEREADLAGYRGNRPVRFGNAAYLQRQHDIYGQILLCLLPLFTDRRFDSGRDRFDLFLVKRLLDRIGETMNEPDAGIWEFRGRRQRHAYTSLFHWAGSKAALKIAKALKDEALAEQARRYIVGSSRCLEECWIPGRGAYAQAAGVEEFDASSLNLITMRYLDPKSGKARTHLAVHEKELAQPSGLMYRYRHGDDFGRPENTFMTCSFWYAEALACVGRLEDARRVFETCLACGNSLGLFSEDAGADFSQWGNFPQTYTHVGLINSAFAMDRALDLPLFF